MDVQYVVLSWKAGAKREWLAARHAFPTRDYPESLFKALIVHRTGKHAPPIHKLVRLAEIAKLDLTPEMKSKLVEITAFNTETRYTEEKAELERIPV
ncbi:MAG: HEPN domain-containing protein [Chloroflexi bacterium]|nr:HEPN domain-containing protein [Chloroflexota bacterium]